MDKAYQSLLVKALKYISVRRRSSREVREYLEKKDREQSESVYQRLEDLGYINDREFAVWWISSRRGSHQKGDRVIALELKAKGISADIVGGLLTGSQELDAARMLFAKKHRMFDVPFEIKKQKIFRYFAGRGFTSSTIHTIIDENS